MSNSKCVYYKEKEQKSFDGGITWVDTGNFRKGALISTQASQCGSYTNEYRWIQADYVCDNGNKYNGYKQQVSYDNGGSWVDTGVVNIGDLIEENSTDCGYNEQWFVLTGDNNFICDGAAKYKKKEMKYTRDSGTTWNSFDPPKYEKGDLIEETSPDCVPPSMKVKYVDGTTKYFANLTSIGEYTVSNKADAKNVEIYDSVIEIGNFAFANCDSLTSISIPNSVTSIGQYAFANCSSLNSITIPNSVTSIGQGAFYECSSLRTMTVEAVTPPTLGNGAIPTTISRIYVPADSVDAYKKADVWKDYADKIWAIGYDEKWFTLTGDKDFICSEGSKYKKKEMKYTRDSGTTWNSFDPPKYEKGDLIESNSSVCPPPSMKVTYVDGSTKVFYNLTSIESNTDSNKKNAKEVIIGSGVTSIGMDAFKGCSSLSSVTIKNSSNKLTYNTDAFAGISSDAVLYVPSNLLSDYQLDNSWNSAFNGRIYPIGVNSANLSMVEVFNDGTTKTFYNLTSIDQNTDSDRWSYPKTVVIYDTVKSIGEHTFSESEQLTNVIISDSVISIGECAFYESGALKNVRLPNGLKSINKSTFEYCGNLTSVNIPDSVSTIGEDAFHACNKLTSIKIPNRVTKISEGTFSYCSSLTGITIPNNVTEIDAYAFSDCSGFTSITIPEHVASIGDYAFERCNNLKTITVQPTTPPTLGKNAIPSRIPNSLTRIYVPKGSLYTYKSADGWKDYADKIYESETIAAMKVTYTDGSEKTFYDVLNIEQDTDPNKANAEYVEIYNGVTGIGDYAFYRCENLKSVEIPDSLISIGQYAFSETNIRGMTLPENVASIGNGAFEDCENMNSITINAYKPPKLGGTDVFLGSVEKIFVPAPVVSSYKTEGLWKYLADKIKAIPQ